MKDRIPVSELYESYQGEGPYAGYRVMFLRTQFCPVGCTWCDSKFTWEKPKDTQLKSSDNILNQILASGVARVVITGGEPLVWREPLVQLVQDLTRQLIYVDFETSGTQKPLDFHHSMVSYIVSPKPPSANAVVPTNDEAIHDFIGRGSEFKFVVGGTKDLVWVNKFITKYGIRQERIWLMPQGTTKEEVSECLAGLFIEVPKYLPRARITGRLHITAFGPERGV